MQTPTRYSKIFAKQHRFWLPVINYSDKGLFHHSIPAFRGLKEFRGTTRCQYPVRLLPRVALPFNRQGIPPEEYIEHHPQAHRGQDPGLSHREGGDHSRCVPHDPERPDHRLLPCLGSGVKCERTYSHIGDTGVVLMTSVKVIWINLPAVSSQAWVRPPESWAHCSYAGYRRDWKMGCSAPRRVSCLPPPCFPYCCRP